MMSSSRSQQKSTGDSSSNRGPSDVSYHFDLIKSEDTVLKRLLYRNNNQHGKTKVFLLFSQLYKHLQTILKIPLQELNESVRTYSRVSYRSGSDDISKCVCLFTKIFEILTLLIKASRLSSSAASLTRSQLSIGLFATIYSTLVALGSSMFDSFSNLAIQFSLLHSLLSNQLENIAAGNDKWRENIRSTLRRNVLSCSENSHICLCKAALYPKEVESVSGAVVDSATESVPSATVKVSTISVADGTTGDNDDLGEIIYLSNEGSSKRQGSMLKSSGGNDKDFKKRRV